MLWATCACVLLAPTLALVLYVSPSGKDTNPGTRNAPLQTISHAYASINRNTSSNVIHVMTGVYGSTNFFEMSFTTNVTIVALEGATVVWSCENSSFPFVSSSNIPPTSTVLTYLTVMGVTFSGCTAGSVQIGPMCPGSRAWCGFDLTFDTCAWDNTNDGGVALTMKSSCNWNTPQMNIVFNNCSIASGSGVVMLSLCNVPFNVSLLLNSTTIQEVNGVALDTTMTSVTLDDSFVSFVNTPSSVVSINGGYACVLTNSQITDNMSNGSIVSLTNTNAYFDNTVFANNEASSSSTIALSASALTLNNVKMIDNIAYSGGGVSLWSASTLNVLNSVFDQNTASQYGGVFYANEASRIQLSHTSVIDNMAQTGGAVYCVPQSSCYLAADGNTQFTDNTSKDGSAPIQCTQSNPILNE